MKKMFLLIFLMGLIFIQCGKKGEEGIVIRYWDTHHNQEKTGRILHELIDKYDKEHPEITIKRQYIFRDNFDEKLATAIVGKSPPDVILLDRFVTSAYADKDSIIPLDEFIKKDGIKSTDYFKACWNEGVYDNKTWSIPHHTDIRVLYYRVDDFLEVGLDPNKPPKTWDQLFAYAKKLTKRDKNGFLSRIGFVPDWGNSYLHIYALANGGRFMRNGKITCNEPKIVEALTWMVNFNAWYGRENVLGAQQGFGERDMDPLIMGKLSMIIDGDWYLGILEEYGPHVKVKIAPPPVPKGMPPSSWSGGWAFAIPNGSKHAKESWKLIKYLTEYEAQITYATQAYRIPALKKAAQNKFFKTHKDYKVFLKMMKYTKYRPVTPIAQFYWDEVKAAMDYAVLKKKTPKQALDDAAKRTQKFLNEHIAKKAKKQQK